MEPTLREARSQWFVLSDSPGIAYPADRFGDDWNGWATPVVTAPTLAILLLTVISDPVSTYVAFAIDAAGTCTLQDREGRLDTLEPADDGGYDLGGLGWTFRVQGRRIFGENHVASSV